MVVVTGGTGLVGSHLLLDLVKKNQKIIAIKRSDKNLKNVINLFSFFYPNEYKKMFDKIIWKKGDILDYDFLQNITKNAKKIFHCAALISFDSSKKKMMKKVNVEGTKNIVDVALENKIEKLCYVSSITVMGEEEKNTYITEETERTNEKNYYYSQTKFEAELEVWRAIAEGLNAVIVNPSIIFGIGDFKNGSLTFFNTVYNGLPFYTSGKTAFVDVKDLVKIMIELMESDISNERFIVSENNYFYKEILEKIAKHLNKRAPKILANSFLLSIFWRLEFLRSKLFFAEPKITKETAILSQKISIYSNEKIKNRLNFSFKNMDKTIKEISKFILKK